MPNPPGVRAPPIYDELLLSVLILLGICSGWKGLLIRCVTRGREGGREGREGGERRGEEGKDGRGEEGRERGGERERGRERGGRGGKEERDDCYTYYSDGSTIFI